MGRVIRIVALFVVLLLLAVAGYLGVPKLLPGAGAGDEGLLWVAGFCIGAIAALAATVLLRATIAGLRLDRFTFSSVREEIIELSEELTNVNETATLGFLLSQRIASILGWERAALFNFEEENSHYHCRRACGTYPAGARVETLRVRRAEPFLQEFLDERGRYRAGVLEMKGALREEFRPYGLTHLLPLVNRGQLVGFIASSRRPQIGPREGVLLRAVLGQAAAALDSLALHEHESIDRLTGFLRPNLFEARLDEELRRSRRLGSPFTVLMVDIDELREINEKWGDDAGDQVIRGVARGLRDKLRRSDIACRSGGEEFTILLPDTNSDQSTVVAENLRSHIEGLRLPGGTSELRLHRTVSIGMATSHPDEPTFADQLLQQARKALLQAKTNGKNTLVRYSDTLPL